MKRALINRHITIFIILFTLFCFQTIGQKAYTLEGNIQGFGENYFMLRYFVKGVLIEEPIKANKGQFLHSLSQSDGNIINLIFNGKSTFIIFLDEPFIKIDGIFKNTIQLNCKNTPENEHLELYRNTIEKPFDKLKQGKSLVEADEITLKQDKEIRRFIKQYPNHLTSAYLLYLQSMFDITILDEIEQLLEGFASDIKNSYWADRTKTRIFNIRNRPKVGKKVPNFILPDSSGNMITLDSLTSKGKFILIDFWGTWCKPCIEGMPRLKEIQAKYQNELVLCSIAYESPDDKEKWLRAIKKYDMDWINTIDYYEDSVNELYNIYAYPTLLLVSSDGVLVEKIKYDFNGEFEKRISALIKK